MHAVFVHLFRQDTEKHASEYEKHLHSGEIDDSLVPSIHDFYFTSHFIDVAKNEFNHLGYCKTPELIIIDLF